MSRAWSPFGPGYQPSHGPLPPPPPPTGGSGVMPPPTSELDDARIALADARRKVAEARIRQLGGIVPPPPSHDDTGPSVKAEARTEANMDGIAFLRRMAKRALDRSEWLEASEAVSCIVQLEVAQEGFARPAHERLRAIALGLEPAAYRLVMDVANVLEFPESRPYPNELMENWRRALERSPQNRSPIPAEPPEDPRVTDCAWPKCGCTLETACSNFRAARQACVDGRIDVMPPEAAGSFMTWSASRVWESFGRWHRSLLATDCVALWLGIAFLVVSVVVAVFARH